MIEIEAPDGSIVEFPDGTSEQTILRVMRQAYGREKTPILQAAAASVANTATLGAGPGIAARNEAIGKAIGRGDFAGAASKAAGYLTAPSRALLKVAGLPGLATDYSSDPDMAARRQEFQGVMRQAAEDRPLTTFAAGATVPVLGASGRALTMGQRALESARFGGLFGSLYGLNMAPEGQEQMGAATGLAGGATVGAIAAPAIQAVVTPIAATARGVANAALRSDVVRNAINAIDNEIFRRPASGLFGRTNMAIGPVVPPRSRPGRAAPRFVPPNDAAVRAGRLADRAGINASELDARIAAAQADPRGRTMAEMFGEPGIHTAATIARMPGKTREMATQQLEARNAGQARRLERDLTGQDEQSAVDFLSERTRDVAERFLQPVWRQPPTPNDAAVLDAFRRRPSVQAAEADARENMTELIARGELSPEALNDPAQVLHYIKIQIADALKSPMKPGTSAKNLSQGNLNAAVRDISTALEQIRPGYATAMKQLQQAIGPRELAKRMASVRGEDPNIAAALTRNPDVMRDINRLGLDNFGRAVTEESRLYRNAQRIIPSTGSQTTPLAVGMADEMAMGMQNVPTSPQNAITAALNYFAQGINENIRNERGRFLLRVIDDPANGLSPQERQAIANEMMRITRERAMQTAATRGAARGSAAGVAGMQEPGQ
jgi:hypothetical protein